MADNIFRRSRLIAAKHKKRFSDATMAAYALGISPSTLYRIERGEISASPDDCANMVQEYQSIALSEDYCSLCPVAIKKKQLEKALVKSRYNFEIEEDITDD